MKSARPLRWLGKPRSTSASVLVLSILTAATWSLGARAAGETPTPSALVPVTPAGYSWLDPAYRRLYGPGTIVIDRLAYNYVTRRDGLDYVMSQRFRSVADGTVAAIRIFAPEGKQGEYASGTGGRVRIGIYPDDGTPAHAPDMTKAALATAMYVPEMSDGRHHSREQLFPSITMSSNAAFKRGQIYHVVYEQIDAHPDQNYVNINSTTTNAAAFRPARWLSPIDWGCLYGKRPAGSSAPYKWTDESVAPYDGLVYVPLLQVDLVDGTRFGASVMESGNVENRQWTITHDTPIRERFKPSHDHEISGLSVQTAAEAPGDLRWQILQGSTVLAEGTISESTANYQSIKSLTYQQGLFKWYDIPLPTPVTMSHGVRYDVLFTPVGDSRWRFAVQRNGAQWGFEYPAAFWESQAEHQVDGRWTAAYMWDHTRVTSDRSNWRIVLHTR